MSRIFISYKRVDKERVFEIRHLIESHIGEECWIDLDGIESDEQFKNVIIRAISRCEVVLFMYSKAHTQILDFEKDWTVKELNFASSKNKRIVFINIDGTQLTDEFSFDFGMKQQVDGRSTESLNRLIRDLEKWLNIPIEGNDFVKDKIETTDDIKAKKQILNKTLESPGNSKYSIEMRKNNHFEAFLCNAFSPDNIHLSLFFLLFVVTGVIGLILYPLILIIYYERRKHIGKNIPNFYTRYRKAIISISGILYSIPLIFGVYLAYDNYCGYTRQSYNNNKNRQIEAVPEENVNKLYDGSQPESNNSTFKASLHESNDYTKLLETTTKINRVSCNASWKISALYSSVEITGIVEYRINSIDKLFCMLFLHKRSLEGVIEDKDGAKIGYFAGKIASADRGFIIEGRMFIEGEDYSFTELPVIVEVTSESQIDEIINMEMTKTND